MSTRLSICLVAVLLAMTLAPASAAADESGGWSSITLPSLSLSNTKTVVLQGTKQPNGACRYQYVDEPRDIPAAGWARFTIAVDPSTCRKLLEEGTPTDQAAFRAAAGVQGPSAPTSSRRGAWQSVVFSDIVNLLLTSDTTQIYWTYNGSTVSNGTASGSCQPFLAWWTNDYCYVAGSYPPGSYLGNTWSKFHSGFCVGLPTTYIYQYYNKVWGHPDGTAAIAQSSDSIDECIILHNTVYSGYN